MSMGQRCQIGWSVRPWKKGLLWCGKVGDGFILGRWRYVSVTLGPSPRFSHTLVPRPYSIYNLASFITL